MKTKHFIFLTTFIFYCQLLTAQCEDLYLDLMKGSLNGIKPNTNPKKIKEYLPCYTGETTDEQTNYGGGVFYLNHGFYFYTRLDMLNIREDFKGEISHAIFGLKKHEIKNTFKGPYQQIYSLRDIYDPKLSSEYNDGWYTPYNGKGDNEMYFKKKKIILIFQFEKNTVNELYILHYNRKNKKK